MSINTMEVYIKCPKCGHVEMAYDYHENESSDNSEVFEVLNIGAPSCHIWCGNPFTEPIFQCSVCGAKFPFEKIFTPEYCSVEDVEKYKKILYCGLYYYITENYTHFSDWDLDWSEQPALSRLRKMYPSDRDFSKLEYYFNIARCGNKKIFIKFESAERIIEKSQIVCPVFLKKVYLHNGVEIIGSGAFANTLCLCDIFLPDSVHKICDKSFFKSAIRKIHMSDYITEFGESAFEECKSLTDPWIPSKLKIIGSRAFYRCISLKSVMIPESVEKIGKDAFANCPNLTIKCKAGTVAHHYAEKNGIKYKLVEEKIEYDLERFKLAQQTSYHIALQEIRSGRKKSHWIWYIFPQLKGLGKSYNSNYYGIQNLEEARAYMQNPDLAERLREISGALLELEDRSIRDIMGVPDDIKLQSCMTLFAAATEDNQIFLDVLDKYFAGRKNRRTLSMIENQ